MRIWAISDTHTKHDQLKVPDVDIVIHSGDAAMNKSPELNYPEMEEFLLWFRELPIKHKVLIAGNHDTSIERGLVKPRHIKAMGINYLFGNDITIEGIKIWGSPYTPEFGTNWAFNCNRGTLYRKHWSRIPEDTDIVITHGPPYDILDVEQEGSRCGCKGLAQRMEEVKPAYHIFGHIHEQAGRMLKQADSPTYYINASILNLKYQKVNNGIIFNYEKE